MELITIFGLQFALSVAVIGLLAKWYLVPWLREKPLHFALGVLIAPHAFRHIGLSFLVPGLTTETIPNDFASAAAYGDFASGLLALAAIVTLRYRWAIAIPLAWSFNIVGTVDLVYALSHASAVPHLGTTWLIPTFIVPALLVTHFMVFTRLVHAARCGETCKSRSSKSVGGQSEQASRKLSATILMLAVTMLGASSASAADGGESESKVTSRTRIGVRVASDVSDEFPYESKYIQVLGTRMHYIDEGNGDTFLFLHGNPTSSYLWRNVMGYVKPHARIVAVDNIGFGKSDKPDVDYTFQTHYRFTEAFVDKVGLKDIIVVGNDWGSLLGLHYAVTHSENVKGVVFMEALIPPTFPMKSVA